MSTTETKKVGFIEAEADALPRLFCVGKVAEVGECKATEAKKPGKANYIMQQIRVSPVGPGKTAFVNLLVRPEWLRKGFDPKSMTKLQDGKAMAFVYRTHIAGKGTVSTLKGLCGNQERFDELTSRLFDLPEITESTLKETLQAFFIDEVDADDPPLVGYDLTQKRDKTDEINPKTGKPFKVLTAGYEVGEWWFPTEKAKKSKVNTANNAAKNRKADQPIKYRVAFETDEDIEVDGTDDDVPF